MVDPPQSQIPAPTKRKKRSKESRFETNDRLIRQLKERDGKHEIKGHIADLKRMMKDCMIAKNARGHILAKGNDHNEP